MKTNFLKIICPLFIIFLLGCKKSNKIESNVEINYDSVNEVKISKKYSDVFNEKTKKLEHNEKIKMLKSFIIENYNELKEHDLLMVNLYPSLSFFVKNDLKLSINSFVEKIVPITTNSLHKVLDESSSNSSVFRPNSSCGYSMGLFNYDLSIVGGYCNSISSTPVCSYAGFGTGGSPSLFLDKRPWGVAYATLGHYYTYQDVNGNQIFPANTRVWIVSTGLETHNDYNMNTALSQSFIPTQPTLSDHPVTPIGTMAAGIIGGKKNNSGILGLVPGVEIVGIKTMGSTNNGPNGIYLYSNQYLINALDYIKNQIAILGGNNVIMLHSIPANFDHTITNLLLDIANLNTSIVIPAPLQNIDISNIWPYNILHPNIIVVGAHDECLDYGAFSVVSNALVRPYGSQIQYAFPSARVYSTVPNWFVNSDPENPGFGTLSLYGGTVYSAFFGAANAMAAKLQSSTLDATFMDSPPPSPAYPLNYFLHVRTNNNPTTSSYKSMHQIGWEFP